MTAFGELFLKHVSRTQLASAAKLLLNQKEKSGLKGTYRDQYIIPLDKRFVQKGEIKMRKKANIKNICYNNLEKTGAFFSMYSCLVLEYLNSQYYYSIGFEIHPTLVSILPILKIVLFVIGFCLIHNVIPDMLSVPYFPVYRFSRGSVKLSVKEWYTGIYAQPH